MAELPELETLRRELEKESVGKRFKVPEVTGTKVAKRAGGKKVLQARLEGAKVKSVDRRGPFLVGNLDTGDHLLLDLGEKGYLEKVAPRSTAPKGTVLTLAFTQGGQIRLVDTSGTAQVFVVATDAVAEEAPELAAIGLDPVADPVSWTSFARALLARNLKLKALLMDQEVVAGEIVQLESVRSGESAGGEADRDHPKHGCARHLGRDRGHGKDHQPRRLSLHAGHCPNRSDPRPGCRPAGETPPGRCHDCPLSWHCRRVTTSRRSPLVVLHNSSIRHVRQPRKGRPKVAQGGGDAAGGPASPGDARRSYSSVESMTSQQTGALPRPKSPGTPDMGVN